MFIYFVNRPKFQIYRIFRITLLYNIINIARGLAAGEVVTEQDLIEIYRDKTESYARLTDPDYSSDHYN